MKTKFNIIFLAVQVLLALIILAKPNFLCAQEIEHKSSITLMMGSFNSKSYIQDLMQDSVYMAIRLDHIKIFIDRMIPINQISAITIYSEPKSSRGALRGLLTGIATGFVGIGASITGNDNYELNTPYVGATLFTSTLVGLACGSRSPSTFIIPGDSVAYHNQLEEMKSLLK